MIGVRGKCVVTGAAGFIGSTLVRRLLRDGWEVLGIDSFDPYYDRSLKEENLKDIRHSPRLCFLQRDLSCPGIRPGLDELLKGADVVYHLAGRPGVRGSWGLDFELYLKSNVLATQILLEALSKMNEPPALVLASSSSVYGHAGNRPLKEEDPVSPVSPYGVTKLACENLGRAYSASHGLRVVCLRYFTVYGPRQRPDMAIQRFIWAALSRRPIVVHGDGSQLRDFTYVDDAVECTVRAGHLALNLDGFRAINVGGGSAVSLNRVISAIARLIGRPLCIERTPPQAGDVRATLADPTACTDLLGFKPSTPLSEGIRNQLRWARVSMRTNAGV